MRRLIIASIIALLFTLPIAVAYASPPIEASGTFSEEPPSITVLRTAGGNTILSWITAGSLTGTVSGTLTDNATIVIHNTGTWDFQGLVTCSCTVGSQSGTLFLRYEGKGVAFGPSQAKVVILSGTGGLANLHGQGTFDLPAPGAGTYSGQFHFDHN